MAFILLLASACGKEDSSPAEEYIPSESAYSFSDEAKESLQNLKNKITGIAADKDDKQENIQRTVSSGKCGLAFIGTADVSECSLSVNQLAFDTLLSDGGYSGLYSFVSEVGSDKICESEWGTQLFMIVPTDDVSEVRFLLPSDSLPPDYTALSEAAITYPDLSKAADSSGKASDDEISESSDMTVVYDAKNADPLFVCVNTADNPQEGIVEIILKDGETISFSPSLDYTGKPLCPDNIIDLSTYSDNADAAYLKGTWECAGLADDTGNTKSVVLCLGGSDDGNAAVCSIFSDSENFAGEALYIYTGTWSLAPEGSAHYSAESLVLELEASGGSYIEHGVPVHKKTAAFSAKKDDENLLLTHVYGDALIEGLADSTLKFCRIE